jgi:hypothetical protein
MGAPILPKADKADIEDVTHTGFRSKTKRNILAHDATIFAHAAFRHVLAYHPGGRRYWLCYGKQRACCWTTLYNKQPKYGDSI